MTKTRILIPLLLSCGLALSGCTSKTVRQDQYSGYLSSYQGLEKVKTDSGATVMRWVDPAFDVSRYDSLVFQPLNFYPQARPDERIDQATLDAVLVRANQQMGNALRQRLPLVSPQQAGPRTLVFRGAITGVNAKNQGLRAYEVLPITLLLAGAMTAAGERDQNTELYLEGELVDHRTGQPVMRLVRKGFGKTLRNDRQKLTAADINPVIDQLTRDALSFHTAAVAR